MNLISMKPLKVFPTAFIYHKAGFPQYNMGSTVYGNKIGEMITYPWKEKNEKFLWIQHLWMLQKRAGYGTKFLNFAKRLSNENGCNGRIRLIAAPTVYDNIPPHIFYRKYGFGSDNKKLIKKIDHAIKHQKLLNEASVPWTLMYYPDKPAKPGLWQRLKMGLLGIKNS